MSTRRAMFVDRQGNRPAEELSLRLESREPVKLTKFFVALGFVAAANVTPEGRRYALVQADGVRLEIHPAREPQPIDDWHMMLAVVDAAAAIEQAVAQGGSIETPLNEFPGGRRCVVVSPDGKRVVVVERQEAVASVFVPPLPPVDFEVTETRAKPPVFDALDDVITETVLFSAGNSIGAPEDGQIENGNRRRSMWADYSPADMDSLRNVQIASVMMAAGYFFFGMMTLYLLVIVMAKVNRARQFGFSLDESIFVIAFGIWGWGMVMGAKSFVFKEDFRSADTALVKIALVADVFGAVGTVLTADGRGLPWSALGMFASMTIAGFAFARYLGQVAESVEDNFLQSAARAVLYLCGQVIFCGMILLAGMLAGPQSKFGATLFFAGIRGLAATLLMCQVGYVAFALIMAWRINPTGGSDRHVRS